MFEHSPRERARLALGALLLSTGCGGSCPPAPPTSPPVSGSDSEKVEVRPEEAPAPGPSAPRRFQLGSSEVVDLASKETGRDYSLIVGVPPSFESEPDRLYPTLFLLDGQWDFALVNSVVGGLVYDEVIPEVLIVGITYSGENPDYGALRGEDYVPTRAKPDYADQAFGGDAPPFLSFIESSVIPLIEKRYRADPEKRMLSGASFGGLFTLYALFERPELFQTYLALSPSVPWDERYLFRREEAFSQDHQTLEKRVWLSVGDSEWPDYFQANKEFFEKFASRNYDGLTLGTRIIEGERHAGNKPEAYNRALRFAFDGWVKPARKEEP